jgi:hypothetical protein
MSSILNTLFHVSTTHEPARATKYRNRLAPLSVFELNNRDFVMQTADQSDY